jgi:hypothetical protein
MGADKHEKRRRGRLPPFVPLFNDTLDAPAWRALSHGAKALYIALKRRCVTNGKVYLSFRDARQELRSGLTEIGRWYRELEHYGFIVKTAAGHLGVEGKGVATKWRLTEIECMNKPATHDFLRWDGRRFDPKKQDPDPESWNRAFQESGSPAIQKAGAPKARSDPESWIKQNGVGCSRNLERN